MTSGREEPKKEFGSEGQNLMGGGAPKPALVGRRDRPGHRRTLREQELRKGEGASPGCQGGDPEEEEDQESYHRRKRVKPSPVRGACGRDERFKIGPISGWNPVTLRCDEGPGKGKVGTG